MSLQLINRSPDLKKLRDEGYELEITQGLLQVHSVPYLTSKKEVKRGTLVCNLTLAGDITTVPDDHQAHFNGEVPCNADGTPLSKIINNSQEREMASGVRIAHSFSAKPQENGGRYPDYYLKITTYVSILSGPAQSIDPTATAKTFAVVQTQEEESVFKYVDTASSRASIGMITAKLQNQKIAVIGAGGTGSYVIDLVTKTPVAQINIFDGDFKAQHNAFRAPGAATIQDLAAKKNKAQYYANIYSNMHRGIKAHPYKVDSTNIELLKNMDFVFICIDHSPAKKLIVKSLEEWGISFIDVGMGLFLADNKIGGVLRVTVSTSEKREHVHEAHRISFLEGDVQNEYNANIQIAELNCMNASLAVIKWKKLYGFYLDFENEHFTTYTLDGNALSNEDKNEAEK